MRCHRAIPIVFALAGGLALAGCGSLDSFDPTSIFNPKKPLPGERKAVFPEGVPGVPEGVPPDLVKGYEPPSEPQVILAEPEPPKPRPQTRPQVRSKAQVRPRQAAAPSQPAPDAAQPQAAPAPWPSTQQTASQPAPSGTQSPFPDPPPPGGFSR
jgi:hypothetical protein